jgi:succinate dehydrogenase/fumarate reductase flavoprotein subunit
MVGGGVAGGLTEDVFELDADVVVVGSGAAACSAAVIASHEGASVLVLERGEVLGGTTALSGAGAWIPNNHLMEAEGVADPKGPALRYMAQLAEPTLYDPESPSLGLPADAYALLETYYDKGREAIIELMALGAADFYTDMALPDYYAEHPENRAPYGRKISPQERKQSHDAAGPALIARMLRVAEQQGAQVRTGHRVVGLVRNEAGEVVGVEVHAGTRALLARARRAVVFATGGFLHDAELKRQFLAGPCFGGCAVPGATGDFVRIGIKAGAQLANMTRAWWYQVALEHAVGTGHVAGGLFMPFGDAMVQVNRHGRRVMDEKAPYNERGPVHHAWDGKEHPNLVLFAIYDDDVAQSPDPNGHRWPIPQAGQQAGYVLTGQTFAELADRIRERLHELRSHIGGFQLADDFVPNLEATIARFDELARKGVDEDFGRGESALSHYWGTQLRGEERRTMHPFRPEGPYHCILLVPGALDTNGGPKINTRAQVLDVDDQPIPGLYGAGNCVGAPAGAAYWGPGATIGAAITFGWIAGRQAAQEPTKAL